MKNITLLDGASGTRLWELSEAAGLPKSPSWTYNLEHPEFVTQVASEYVAAGTQILCTNTFTANHQALRGKAQVADVVTAAVAAAKSAAAAGVRVALDIGPLTELLEPYGDLEEDEAEDIFAEVIDAGVAAGVDLIFFETFMDLQMLLCGVRAARRHTLPIFCSMSFQKGGRTMMGNSVADVTEALAPMGIDAIGLNCSLGPVEAVGVLQEFAAHTGLPLIFKPNAGLPVVGPDGKSAAPYTAETFAGESVPALELASYVGACCGSNADYIRALKAKL